MHAVTKKKCTAKIITDGKNTMAPAYLRVWNYYKFTTPKVEKFFFCPNDIECSVKGSQRKWVDKFSHDKKTFQFRLCGMSNLALVSLVQRSLNLKMQVFDFSQKNASLQLDSSTPPLNLSGVDVLHIHDPYLTSRQSKLK
jgi:hypothetical protein